MRELIIYPNEILTTKAEEVDPEEISMLRDDGLFSDMLNITSNHEGRGLSAPQLGVRKRVIFIFNDNHKAQILINPVITVSKGKIISHQEGCLSLPGRSFNIRRAREVKVEALDDQGNPVVIHTRREITSIVLQHEIDHLNGILILNQKKSEFTMDELKRRKQRKRKKKLAEISKRKNR